MVRSSRTHLWFGLGLLASSSLLSACMALDAGDFKNGVPRAETVALDVPGAATTETTQGALGVQQVTSALLGETAEYYRLTRTVTVAVNGGTGAVLRLVRAVVQFPPSSLDGDQAVWGPYTEALSPNTWKLTVTHVEGHTYDYRFDAKAKDAPDSAFVRVLWGRHTASEDANGRPVEIYGHGNATLDWEAARQLPEHDDNRGRAEFSYAHDAPGQPVTIDVDFTGIRDENTGELFDAAYRYASTPGAGGELKYLATQDMLPEPGNTGSARETLTLHSRWQETGAGRSDAKVVGGDLPSEVTVNECWDASFASSYKSLSYDPAGGWGAETSCVFPAAEYAAL